jgi:hypothetical protein
MLWFSALTQRDGRAQSALFDAGGVEIQCQEQKQKRGACPSSMMPARWAVER